MKTTSFRNDGDRTYRLRDLKNGKYQFHVKNGDAVEGTIFQVMGKAEMCGIRLADLHIAVVMLQQYNHDFADFSANGRILSYGRDERGTA